MIAHHTQKGGGGCQCKRQKKSAKERGEIFEVDTVRWGKKRKKGIKTLARRKGRFMCQPLNEKQRKPWDLGGKGKGGGETNYVNSTGRVSLHTLRGGLATKKGGAVSKMLCQSRRERGSSSFKKPKKEGMAAHLVGKERAVGNRAHSVPETTGTDQKKEV